MTEKVMTLVVCDRCKCELPEEQAQEKHWIRITTNIVGRAQTIHRHACPNCAEDFLESIGIKIW